ncbi:MAG TPA: S9 family peptidase [Gemmatimonadaceae bacterium]|nr:S9 family peptidase [Gemmatimonadaceae bacterium]
MKRRCALFEARLWAGAFLMFAGGGVPGIGGHATPVSQWLVLGPVSAVAPAFGATSDSAMLASGRVSLAHGWPADGQAEQWVNGASVTWKARAAAGGAVTLEAQGGPALAFAVTYLDADRWTRAKITVPGGSARLVTLDGAPLRGETATLERGKHVLMVAAVARPGAAFSLSASVEATTPGATITAGTDPTHPASLQELMATTDIGSIAVDPSGNRVAWVARHTDVTNDDVATVLEVHDLATGKLLAQAHGAGISGTRWSRDGHLLAFETATDERGSQGRDLWIWDATTSQARRVLRGERGLGSVDWSPDARWIYFTAAVHIGEAESYQPGDLQRLTQVWDRWSFYPEKAQLYALDVAEGTRVQLLGDTVVSAEAPTVSPDGQQIVFARSVRTDAAPPWLDAEVWVLDLRDRSVRKLVDLPRESFGAPTAFAWSPDSKAVAFCASSEELQPHPAPTFSVYETELYATTVDHPSLVHLSAGFIPAVACSKPLYWSATDGRIYVTADDGAKTIPARTSAAVPGSLAQRPKLEAMSMPGNDIAAYDFAGASMVAAIKTPVSPSVVYRLPLDGGAPTVLDRPSSDVLTAQVQLPTWHPWSFTDSRGTKIEAWYWLPPGFDSTKTYPMIVHYYGGTLPMKETFDERLVWFANNGYIVWMCNPAGTPGYGQAFADLHINDWGYPAGTDIIEGVQQFEKTHPYVQAAHVGNFGHSYGGFMTMHMAERTSAFATSIEISGISNIADYWGVGWTGYSYTQGTCPSCYPWNRRDVYVDRSPLFNADKVHAPMLLIHGTSDTNVPENESEQMFTALRMLGREAELVRVYGENHGINSKPSITRHLYGTMLDWYDRYLRQQPGAWSARWDDGNRIPGMAAGAGARALH